MRCNYTIVGSPEAFVVVTGHNIIVFFMQVKFWDSLTFNGGFYEILVQIFSGIFLRQDAFWVRFY